MHETTQFPEETTPKGPRARRRISRADKSGTITFRLQKDEFRVLGERAAIHQLSVHLYARALVLETLFHNSAFEEIGIALSEVQGATHKLRADLAFSMKTLLMTAGHVSEDKASEWVARNFQL